MFKLLIISCVITIIINSSTAQDISLSEGAIPNTEETTRLQDIEPVTPDKDEEEIIGSNDIRTAIEYIENTAALADKNYREGIIPIEDTESQYDEILNVLDHLIDIMKESSNIYTFLKLKGIDRVISPNLKLPYSQLREKLLILTKTLFNMAPITTKSIIPMNMVDQLMEIFENDDNLALKAHALDVLYIWLPDNPKIQARVMKLNGLEPFYEQITKLDTSVIYTILDLFNKILNEHLQARNEKKQTSKLDLEKLKYYQRIGLIERMSTPTVCNGLLNIFESTLSYNTDDNYLIVPVLKLIANVQQFCLKIFRGRSKAIDVFDDLLKYVEGLSRSNYLNDFNLNITDIKEILKEYVDKLKYVPDKDEL